MSFFFLTSFMCLQLPASRVSCLSLRWREEVSTYPGELHSVLMDRWKATGSFTSPLLLYKVCTHICTLTGVHVDSCADTSLRLSAGVTKLVTVDVKGSWQRWLKVRDLIKGETYTFSVQALTVSYGPPIQANITAQPVKGMIGCIESCQIQLEIAVYCTWSVIETIKEITWSKKSVKCAHHSFQVFKCLQ